MDVALGGTFDPIHDGHRALFDRAFELGNVVVGLTTDALAGDLRPADRPIRPHTQRRADLEAELQTYADQYDRTVEIEALDDPAGIASERPALDHLVVSPETADAADHINQLRRDRGMDPLTVHVVDHVRAEDGDIISSTRILRGEIDEHGHVIADDGATHSAVGE
ncbi:MAG: phosphopantetheine adenylyltransferase [Salinarchaeum sp.]